MNKTPTVHNTLFIGSSTDDPIPLPLDEILKHHAEVRDATAQSMHMEHQVASDLATFVSMISFVYAFNTYKALGLLLPELYHESGAVVFRQLWEVSRPDGTCTGLLQFHGHGISKIHSEVR